MSENTVLYFVGSHVEGNRVFSATLVLAEAMHFQVRRIQNVSDFETPPSNSIFIVHNKDKEVWEALIHMKARVFGPQVLLEYDALYGPLPVWPTPLFSCALRNITVCVTAFEFDHRQIIYQQIEMMHGKVSRDFTDEVDILIAPFSGTQKYHLAASRRIPVVRETWLHELWELSTQVEFMDDSAEELVSRHRLPIFTEMVICGSGFTLEKRNRVKNIVEMNGAQFTVGLQGATTTHLIAAFPSGPMYNAAKMFNITIVSPAWLIDSIDQGYALKESRYVLQEAETASNEIECRQEDTNSELITHAPIDGDKRGNDLERCVIKPDYPFAQTKLTIVKRQTSNQLTVSMDHSSSLEEALAILRMYLPDECSQDHIAVAERRGVQMESIPQGCFNEAFSQDNLPTGSLSPNQSNVSASHTSPLVEHLDVFIPTAKKKKITKAERMRRHKEYLRQRRQNADYRRKESQQQAASYKARMENMDEYEKSMWNKNMNKEKRRLRAWHKRQA